MKRNLKLISFSLIVLNFQRGKKFYIKAHPSKIMNVGVGDILEYNVKFLKSTPNGEYAKNNVYWISEERLDPMPSVGTASLHRPFSRRPY